MSRNSQGLDRTLAEKIIDEHLVDGQSGRDSYLRVYVDAVLGHDATIALLIDQFRQRKLKIWDTERVLFVNDHFSPPATVERAAISAKFLQFAREQQIENLSVDQGICHQLLVEHPICKPGSLIIGADSHTIMGGALGACATGMGSTDLLFTLATGTTWMKRPSSIKVTFTGELPSSCSGHDVALYLLRLFGEGGANYRSLEFHDLSDSTLSQDNRFTISNMAVEMGAKFGVFVPDTMTQEYCLSRDGYQPNKVLRPDIHAMYERALELDLTSLTPQVAQPWSPANVVSVDDVEVTRITTVFVGSCAGGRLSDIRDAASVLTNKKIHHQVRMIVIPASVRIFKNALRLGYVETLVDAGVSINHPSCGPCGGIDKGVLGPDDVCVSTSNRNFRGRMGHWNSRTFLASAKTAATSAVSGTIGSRT